MPFSVIGPSYRFSHLIFTHSYEVGSFFSVPFPHLSPTNEEDGALLMLCNYLPKVAQVTFAGARI